MSASLLIKQSTGMIHEHLYQSNSTIKLATARSAPAVLSLAIAPQAGDCGVVVPILGANFLSSSPDISLPVANRIRINKDGRYRFKASVNVGRPALTTAAQNLATVAGPPVTATVPASIVFYLNFCDATTINPPIIPALKGKRVVSYINTLNFLQQIELDTVITAFAGDEFSLLATAIAATVDLYGIAVPLEVPYMTLEVSEL